MSDLLIVAKGVEVGPDGEVNEFSRFFGPTEGSIVFQLLFTFLIFEALQSSTLAFII